MFFITPMYSQKQSDTFETRKGELKIEPIFHSATYLEWNELHILIDPYGDKELFTHIPNPDLIFITDIHQDHMNLEVLESLDLSKTILITPQAVADELHKKLPILDIIVLKNNEKLDLETLKITAIPMYNLPDDENSRHPKGRGNGYLLDFAGTKVYFSGDTEDIPEMRKLKNIDIAFVCMNLPYTMTVEQAVNAVLEFKPKVVYPFHYRGSDGYSDIQSFKVLVNAANKRIDVRIRDWY